MIYVPFAVYTAWHGYAWSSVPKGISLRDMDASYRKIGEWRPNYMSPGDSYEGVFYDNGLVAAFKMQCVQKWDAVGRDVDYCAFAFMGYDMAKYIDFDFLLGLDSFSVPTHKPKNFVEYFGPPSSPYRMEDAVELHDNHVLKRVDFHGIGDMLEKCSEHCNEWMFCRTSFDGAHDMFAQTVEWTGVPAEWSAKRERKKAKLQRINFEDIMKSLGGIQ